MAEVSPAAALKGVQCLPLPRHDAATQALSRTRTPRWWGRWCLNLSVVLIEMNRTWLGLWQSESPFAEKHNER